jgi:hypothetical protein
MAYFSDPNMDDDEQQGQPGQVSGPSGVITGGNAAGQGTGPQQQGQPSRSGSWSNLVSYLNANSGNDAQVGGQIKANVGQDASKADEYSKQFETVANKAINDQKTANDSAIGLSKTTPVSGFKDVSADKLRPQYNGPASADQINEYAQAKQQAENVQATAKLAGGNESDRVSLLDKTFARPGYSQGEKSLDSFILGGGQGGKKALADIQSQYGAYGDRFKTLAQSVGGNLNQIQAETKQANDAVKGNLKSKADEYKAQLAQRVAAENAKRQAEEDQAQYMGATGAGAARDYITQQMQASYGDLLKQFENPTEAEQLAGANNKRYALQQMREQNPFATNWASTSPNETSGAVPYASLGQQFYQGPGQASVENLADPNDAAGYNSLLDFLGVEGKLKPSQIANRSFDAQGYKNALLGQADQYLANLPAAEKRRLGIG